MSRKTSPHRRANSRRLPLPELSDEAAYMMQFFIEDFYLWFSRAYATQIRRYHEPWYGGPTHPPHQTIDEPF
ncbi:hypothetical protein J8I87_43575 [Paraburkholderia sp. LEh10]|uniref:hypothetical protein n=1 Tax=Paraburkholderia sp. LEh10 TaxID=2821353 RepID=UPI001AE8C65D|nr:hypothetical protein [Paraburkholderia sp. LEh10]MBP0596342.1 hypothetical protein [Paraburkholderia sp. LEh10]